MDCVLKLELYDGSEVTLESCVSFSFQKELYVCCTNASGVFYLEEEPTFTSDRVKRISLYINGLLRHYGLPDKVEIVNQSGGKILRFSSRGYTLLLSQNEPYPKINSDVNLKTLIEKNLTIDEIECESDTQTVGYIYVKEKSNIWDAVTAYSLKATGNYPYIRSTNKVCVTMGDCGRFDYSDTVTVSEGNGFHTSLIISDVNMKDINDEYAYSRTFSTAQDLGIVRSKYYALDYQWLYSPDEGLAAKLNYSGRGVRDTFLTYVGNIGEDLMDYADSCGGLSEKRINYIRIWGNSHGIFTRLKCYDDMYGQR